MPFTQNRSSINAVELCFYSDRTFNLIDSGQLNIKRVCWSEPLIRGFQNY